MSRRFFAIIGLIMCIVGLYKYVKDDEIAALITGALILFAAAWSNDKNL